MNSIGKVILAMFLFNIFNLGGLVAYAEQYTRTQRPLEQASIKTSPAKPIVSQGAKKNQIVGINSKNQEVDRAVVEQLEFFARGLLVTDCSGLSDMYPLVIGQW